MYLRRNIRCDYSCINDTDTVLTGWSYCIPSGHSRPLAQDRKGSQGKLSLWNKKMTISPRGSPHDDDEFLRLRQQRTDANDQIFPQLHSTHQSVGLNVEYGVCSLQLR